jgi:hypothetical protein
MLWIESGLSVTGSCQSNILVALEHLRRKLDTEWQKNLSGLRKQLGAVQHEVVQSQMREGRTAKRVKEREEASNLQALSLLSELSV